MCKMQERASIIITDSQSNGIGVGLDTSNRVDMLREGGAAALSDLQMGDKILSWNGMSLLDEVGQQVKLADVVDTTLDRHTVILERAPKMKKSKTDGSSSTPSGKSQAWEMQSEWASEGSSKWSTESKSWSSDSGSSTSWG